MAYFTPLSHDSPHKVAGAEWWKRFFSKLWPAQKKEFSRTNVDPRQLVQCVGDFGIVWLKLCCQALGGQQAEGTFSVEMVLLFLIGSLELIHKVLHLDLSAARLNPSRASTVWTASHTENFTMIYSGSSPVWHFYYQHLVQIFFQSENIWRHCDEVRGKIVYLCLPWRLTQAD